MKRLVVFLLLLGAGIALLFVLEKPLPKKPVIEPSVIDVGPIEDPQSNEASSGLFLDGKFDLTLYTEELGGTRKAALILHGDDSRTIGGVDELLSFEGTRPEPGGVPGSLQAFLEADAARLTRLPDQGTLSVAYQKRVELENVFARVFTGLPLVPLTFRAPIATFAIDEASTPPRELLTSPERIVLESPRMDAQGRELELDLAKGSLAFARDGEMSFRESGAIVATLSSAGPLTAERRSAIQPASVELDARQAARVQLLGARPSELAAEHVRVVGSEPASADAGLVLDRLTAEDDVVWTAEGGVFHAGEAALDFDARGRFVSATLAGEPRARLVIQSKQADSSAPGARVEIAGTGPLVVAEEPETAERAVGIRMGGPATATLAGGPGGALQSQGALLARLFPERGSGTLRAEGGVVLEHPRANLEAAALELEVEPGPLDIPSVHGKTTGGARVVGTLADGREFTLTASGTIEIASEGDHWRVEKADGVVLSVADPDGFRARAASVVDFDPERFTLTANGAVHLESSAGVLHGERLTLRGPRSFVLEDPSGEPVTFDGDLGHAEAVRIEGQGERLSAAGSVRANLLWSSGAERRDRYDVECDELVLERSEELDLDGVTRRRRFELDARGAVGAQVYSGGETTRVRCGRLHGVHHERVLRVGEQDVLQASDSHVEALESVDAYVEIEDARLHSLCDRLELDREELADQPASHRARCSGSVRFTSEGRFRTEGTPPRSTPYHLTGEGDELVLEGLASGRLAPLPGGRAKLAGTLPTDERPFELLADWFAFSPGRELVAVQPEITLAASPETASGRPLEIGGMRVRAARLVATDERADFEGPVVASGTTRAGDAWTLETGSLSLSGVARTESGTAALSAFAAEGGVAFHLGETLVATGRSLFASDALGTLRLEGAPARLETPAFAAESDWVEVDPDLKIPLGTGPGRVLPSPPADATAPAQEGPGGGWVLEVLGSKTLVEPDHLIYAIQGPRFLHQESGDRVSASWLLLWLDRGVWDTLVRGEELPIEEQLFETGRPRDRRLRWPGPLGEIFAALSEQSFGLLLRELYLEGPVQALEGDDEVARAAAIYLDAVDGHGWVSEASLRIDEGGDSASNERLLVNADWLRHSTDGSLVADRATVTVCDQAEPHVKIETGDLRISPRGPRVKDGFRLSLQHNHIEFYGWLRIPLPPISVPLGPDFRPDFGDFRLGDSARLGAFVTAGITRPAGGAGKVLNRVFGGDEVEYDANWRVRASYFGARGGLLDLGLELESKQDYWLEAFLGIIPDRGEDRGFVRVDESERSPVRRWFRGTGRFLVDDDQWVDTSFTAQSDPGVQSEFFEGDFLRYERDESYVHWRKARGPWYLDASVALRTDSFRASIDELPSLGVFRSRAPIGSLAGRSILYSGDARAEFLRRREGDPGVVSPFGRPAQFEDGLGERDVLRFDTTHAIEAPLALSFAALRLTPFVSGRFTAWNEGEDEETSPTRTVAAAGARLSTTFWRDALGGSRHQVAPFVAVHSDVGITENGGDPLALDAVEAPQDGLFVDLGARARLFVLDGRSLLDADLRAVHANDSGGRAARWLPLAVFARLGLERLGLPVEVWHDGRYGLEDGETVYALTSVASKITEDLRLEAGHRRGRGADGQPLFEAATLGGIYTWTEKWEFENRQTFSLLENDRLDTRFLLRRFGHDLVFELETVFRAGEGTSFSVSLKPRFGWRPSSLGEIDE